MKMLTGGCRCGHIRYEIVGRPWFGFICHCTDCQQLSSSAFSMGIAVAEADFVITAGEPKRWTKTGSSGLPSHQYSCPVCSGWTHTKPELLKGGLVARPSTLDDHHNFRPAAEIYARSALPWARQATTFSFDTDFEDVPKVRSAFAAMLPAG